VRTKARLIELGRTFNVTVPAGATIEAQIAALVAAPSVAFRELLAVLTRDELRSACRAHELDGNERSRAVLVARLLDAHGAGDRVPPATFFAASAGPRDVPRMGDVVRVRHRQYLVEAVVPPPEIGHETRVALVCLDDDNQGQRLEVLWELELGAKVLDHQAPLPHHVERLDPPRHFAAYLHALKWNSVTATDARLFQAPFRAGIKLLNHQLTPLKKALELPRANLFIADDVGLGKTIEAGLVAQELILRQRVDFIVIVCPALVTLQWRDEMRKRFGLQFEVYSRAFVDRRRQERGFGVNPWATHHRFIISYQTLRRAEHLEPLRQRTGDRVRKSLLILDEAHNVAPASASKYAVDSGTTELARTLAPCFENRLFLSATPHNGHSNSFSALLEILDPQRFTRGVPVAAVARDAVLVRRLKRDLRELGIGGYPERHSVQVDLVHQAGQWTASYRDAGTPVALGSASDSELVLAERLREYTQLACPPKGRGRLVFVSLQKRLLSSIDAFWRTLQVHADSIGHRATAEPLDFPAALPESDGGGDEYGLADDEEEAALAEGVAEASRALETPAGRARALLDEMLDLAGRSAGAPEARMLALLDWVQRYQCRGARSGGGDRLAAADRRWSDRRVIVFTEYGDTKRKLVRFLRAAIEGTDEADLRIMELHGGMSDDSRETVQTAFNGPPDRHLVRILVCTDAAREGVNLQGHCAHLFHYDVPWNPARMEQRNGRIDRTLQPSPAVWCYYFHLPQRPEDAVLATIVEKIECIRRELGSLGDVVMGRIDAALARDPITPATAQAVRAADDLGGRNVVVERELEPADTLKRIRAELDDAGRILETSQRVADFDPHLLRDALDVGFELSGAARLEPTADDPNALALPALPSSWDATLDSLRPARERGESYGDWRQRPLLPVVFHAPDQMTSDVGHLHLQHPLVQRVMSRFLAQGTSAHDLSRVSIVVTAHEANIRALAFGRLSLFGPGATRLHDQLVAIAAPWFESGGPKHLKPFADERADRRALERLEDALRMAPTLDRVSPRVQQRLRDSAPSDFATLWDAVRNEADAIAQDARRKLDARGHAEAEALRALLADQRSGIEAQMASRATDQFLRDLGVLPADQRRQFDADTSAMKARLRAITTELATEPVQIEALYRVALVRLEPVGLIYLWPESRI
jgi:hypothetical protein